MRLHRILPNSKIPNILKGELVFGDRKQSDALNSMGEKIEKLEETANGEPLTPLKEFKISVEADYSDYETILAKDAAQAREIFDDDFYDIDDITENLDIHISVQEIK